MKFNNYLLLTIPIYLLIGCSNNNVENEMKIIHKDNIAYQSEDHRKIVLDGTSNTRELGGYKTEDGRSLKWGVLYRSDKLSELTDADQEYLLQLGIKRVIDFRSSEEKQNEPDQLPSTLKYIEMPIEADGAIRPKVEAILKGDLNEDVGAILVETNREFISDFSGVYKGFIESLIENQEPTLFHCTAGKDRAGFAAALVLLAVGVPEKIVIEDYMKTNKYTEETIQDYINKINLYSLGSVDAEILRPLLGVEERFIRAALDEIKQKYGSVENFIRDELKIRDESIIELKNFLLTES
ncbi:tyrosine-protein phosphatase [SAR86 cluster bacterium]|nr:tyrosine-protein phosphatase [SAR86 cluster bacterium]